MLALAQIRQDMLKRVELFFLFFFYAHIQSWPETRCMVSRLRTCFIFVMSGCVSGVQYCLYVSSFLSYHTYAACRVQSCLSLGLDDPSIKTPGQFEQLVILLSVCSRRSTFLLRCAPHISTSPGISYQSLQTPERLSLSLCRGGQGRCCITAFKLKKELKRQLRPCAICMRSISAEFC